MHYEIKRRGNRGIPLIFLCLLGSRNYVALNRRFRYAIYYLRQGRTSVKSILGRC